MLTVYEVRTMGIVGFLMSILNTKWCDFCSLIQQWFECVRSEIWTACNNASLTFGKNNCNKILIKCKSTQHIAEEQEEKITHPYFLS